jgi:hypothetical protein
MGASNAIRVYHGWGAKLKDKPLRLLIWMALHAKDDDSEPWYSLGERTHETLAEFALGLQFPRPTGDAHKDELARDAVLRKVRRHLTPLFAAGAISTKRRAVTTQQGVTAVVYALRLDGPPDDDSRAFPPRRT